MEAVLKVHRILPVTEDCHVGQVRRALHDLARQIGSSDDVKARAALVATELTTNLIKHPGSGGEILYRAVLQADGHEPSIELLSLDSGRGIPNISQALQDGFSTAGSPGTGLGAVQRMSDSMEIFSCGKRGTVICVEISPRAHSVKAKNPAIRSVCTPLEGFEVCGDHWQVQRSSGKMRFMLADGLGHGPEAAAASHKAEAAFDASSHEDLIETMSRIHEALKNSRGAAIALAALDLNRRRLSYVAVGNIEARIVTPECSQGCATLNGTAGLHLPKLTQFEYAVPSGALMIMHTDGLSARWDLKNYQGINFGAPGAIAGLLYRDFHRKRDDATVLVAAT